MRPSVYLDTTIPSYYADQRPELQLHIRRTRDWWDLERGEYEVYTSPFTLLELQEGDLPRRQEALDLLPEVGLLAPDPLLDGIVETYVANKLMPSRDIRDAIHLAFASFYKVDYLLT